MENNRYSGGSQQGRRKTSGRYDYFDEPPRRPQQGSPKGGGNNRAPKKKRLPMPLLIFVDVIIGALILLIFYITNYVINWQTGPSSLPKPSWITSSAPAETTDNIALTSPSATTSEQTAPTSAVSADPNDWRAKWPDKFTDGAAEQTDTTYKDANINVSINKVQENNVTYFVADIYIAELKYFKTAFPKNSDKMGDRENTDKIAQETNAIIAINGDHCVDNPGPVVRNGNQYRMEKAEDALVMNYDGSMQTYTADELDLNKIKDEGAYQVWTFGPMLLKDGQPMTQFNSSLGRNNPRTAVGYYEPGHYCFVVVDGRQPGYSDGMDMTQLSQLFSSLGCNAAFNLDGGQSSEMAFMGKIINQPYNGGRSTTDILYVGE